MAVNNMSAPTIVVVAETIAPQHWVLSGITQRVSYHAKQLRLRLFWG
jgi:hypothetical protein